jgi:hypothetical protein
MVAQLPWSDAVAGGGGMKRRLNTVYDFLVDPFHLAGDGLLIVLLLIGMLAIWAGLRGLPV